MYSPEELDSPTILFSLVASVCVLFTILLFLRWLRRKRKHKPREAIRRGKGTRVLPKKRPK